MLHPTVKTLTALAFTSALALTTALGQPYPNATWNLDENGNGTIQGPGLVGYSNGHLQTDPVSGVTTLFYSLAAPTLAGDVVLFEGGATNYSDLVRFDGTGGVYFFSLAEAGEPTPDLADVPFVSFPNPRPGSVFLFEVGPEGNNGVLYTPAPGQPGFDTSGYFPGIMYNIISDAVPEPSSAALLIAGFGAALMLSRRRK